MLIVMDGCGYVAGQHHELMTHLAAQETAMVHDHVPHLHHAGNMQTAPEQRTYQKG